MTPLKKKRLALGLKSKEVAERIGVTPSAYSAWEVGARKPEPAYYPKLAEVFGIGADEVVELIASTGEQRAAAAAH